VRKVSLIGDSLAYLLCQEAKTTDYRPGMTPEDVRAVRKKRAATRRGDGSAMAPAHDLFVRSVSAGAALHAWPRSKVASEACGQPRVRKLGATQ
jgi:hypothetical protein